MTKFHRSENCKKCIECNTRTPLFKHLTRDELLTLNDQRYEVKFRKGEIIFKQGMPANHLISITSGFVKIYVEGIRDRNIILELVKPWQVFGGPGIYVDNRYHYSSMALEDTTACFIDTKNVKKLIRQNPDFAEDFIESCSNRNARLLDRMVSLTQKQMHGRIADALLYLKDVNQSAVFNLMISKQDLADLTSMTRDSAIRILKEFQQDNIIDMQNREMKILDLDKLEEISFHG